MARLATGRPWPSRGRALACFGLRQMHQPANASIGAPGGDRRAGPCASNGPAASGPTFTYPGLSQERFSHQAQTKKVCGGMPVGPAGVVSALLPVAAQGARPGPPHRRA